MQAYKELSNFYDEFTNDVPYDDFITYYKSIFSLYNKDPKLVLDLGCGTGTLTCKMAELGYDMIGIDGSFDMLMQAQNKSYEMEENRPLFLCQKMHEIDLFGTVDACVSSLDCINYITDTDELIKTFAKVDNFLDPDGIFVFDINSTKKLKNLDGQAFTRESEDAFCIWQSSFDDDLCTYEFNIFTQSGEFYERNQEIHTERAYSVEFLIELLENAGFYDIKCFDELSQKPADENSDRIFIACKSKGDKKIG